LQEQRAHRMSLMMLASMSIENGPMRSIRVRNLSSTGMSAVSEQPLRVCSDVKVKLTDLIWAIGRIVRTDGRSFAVAFDTPIDLSVLNFAPTGTKIFEVSSMHKVTESTRRPRIRS
jgi:hypothetical protein